MTQELTTNESFQEKMFNRIRESMGDLMSNDDLKKIVEASLQKAFFEDRIIRTNYRDEKKPALFIELISDHLKSQIKIACEDYLKNNPDKINETIKDCIGKGFLNLMSSWFENKLYSAMNDFKSNLQSQGLIK